jgi:hypothetical protein
LNFAPYAPPYFQENIGSDQLSWLPERKRPESCGKTVFGGINMEILF